MKTVTFFNNKGGVGKTTLVYHLSWMFAELGLRVIAADFDPQANLSSMFLDDDRLEQVWPGDQHTMSVMGAISDLIDGVGDVRKPHIEEIGDALGLLIGDLALARIEDELSEQWPKCLDRNKRAFRVTSAFYRILDLAASDFGADVIILDVGPNLGAINRTAIIASDFVGVPLAPDLYSLQGLRNLGPTLTRWREEWQERLAKVPEPSVTMPKGQMMPVGYVMMQHAVRNDRPVKSYNRWADKIPSEYAESVLQSDDYEYDNGSDPNCLAQLKHYRSLMPMAMEARKPMFFLKPADGAIGAHSEAVSNCYKDFRQLAGKIAKRCELI